jgi:serine/threonine protein kinase
MHHTKKESQYPQQCTALEQTNWIVSETRRTIDTLQRDSDFFSNNPPKPLPTFQERELRLGETLGNGEFGMVVEVKGFDLDDNGAADQSKLSRLSSIYQGDLDEDDFPVSLDNKQARKYMGENVLRAGNSRFAIKRVRPDLTDERKGNSAVDLAVEAQFLSSINHSNIIKLRATVSKPGHDSFMIVLDRLYSILNQTIERWKTEVKALKGPFGIMVVNKVNYYRSKTERLLALYDIARALKHLHSLKILYRDLKPENIVSLKDIGGLLFHCRYI